MQSIDHHCHPLRRWPFTLTALELRSVFSEAVDAQIARDHVPHTVAYRIALRYLADELGCEPEEEAILDVRNRQDPAIYARRMLEKSQSGMLLLDCGFSGGDAFAFEEHGAATRIPQREIVRLETLAEGLVRGSASATDWFTRVKLTIREAVARGGQTPQ